MLDIGCILEEKGFSHCRFFINQGGLIYGRKEKIQLNFGQLLNRMNHKPKKNGEERLSSRPFPDQYLTDFTQISSGEYSTA